MGETCYYCDQFAAADPDYDRHDAVYAVGSAAPRCHIHWRYVCYQCRQPAHFMATAFCTDVRQYFCMGCANAVVREPDPFAAWSYYFSLESPWSGRLEPSLDRLEFDGAHPARQSAGGAPAPTGLSPEFALPHKEEASQWPARTDIELSDVRDIWNTNARRWDAGLQADGDETRRYWSDAVLLNMMGSVTDKRIIDLGCGNGYLSRILAARGADVTGVDLSDEMVAHAETHAQQAGRPPRYQQSSITDLSGLEDCYFDGAVCNYVLHDVANYEQALAEINRVLKLRGYAVLTLTHPCFSSGPRNWHMRVPDSPREEDAIAYLVDDYFQDRVYMLGDWRGFTPVPYFHRPLSSYWQAFTAQGFAVVDFHEPRINETGHRELGALQVEHRERVALCCVFGIRKIAHARTSTAPDLTTQLDETIT